MVRVADAQAAAKHRGATVVRLLLNTLAAFNTILFLLTAKLLLRVNNERI